MYTIEDYTTKDNIKVIIGYDDCSEYMFDDLWYDVTFISNHRDYADKGPLSHLTIEHILDKDIPEGYECVPVHAYIHGGIALSLGSFSCRWDSGTFGFVLFKTGEFGEDNQGLKGFIEEWDALLNGNVYLYHVEDLKTGIEECCGGFTDMDYMEKEVDSVVKKMIRYRKKTKEETIKTLIRNRVPLHHRQERIA